MRIPMPPIRPLCYLVVAAGFVLGAVDGGSVVLTRLAVPDDVRAAGQAAAGAVEGQPTNRQTAAVAYEVASDQARPHGLTVSRNGFTLYPDGRVQLTASRTAPTLLLDRVPALQHFAEASVTETVAALPYR